MCIWYTVCSQLKSWWEADDTLKLGNKFEKHQKDSAAS